MVTLQAKLKFLNKKDKQTVLDLMIRWSACKRYAYNRLLENKDRNTLKRELQKIFNLNSRYVDDTIAKANAILKSCKELKINPKRIIFGTKKLFQKLKKKHLDEHKRKKLKEDWIEKRQGTLYSRGDKSKQGNLNLRIEPGDEKFYLRINTGVSKEKRDYLLWHIVHAIINLAIEKNKAIVIEKLEKLPLGTKGDGMKKLRKRLHQMCYRAILERIKVLGPRKGVKVIEINPAYTSVIGALKYAPVLGIDKDIAGAYVIGRRGMKLKEKIPVNYEKLLNDIEYLSYAILRYETEIAQTKEKLDKENNKWKKNAIKAHLKTLKQNLKQVKKRIEKIQSTVSESGCQEQVSGWNKPVRGEVASPIPWQVVSVATVMPLLGRVFVRDYAPLKRVLVSEEWERLVEALRLGLRLGQAPVPGAGAMDTPNSACVGLEYPEHGGLQIPTHKLCEFAQFS